LESYYVHDIPYAQVTAMVSHPPNARGAEGSTLAHATKIDGSQDLLAALDPLMRFNSMSSEPWNSRGKTDKIVPCSPEERK
jgi:hypothetical protein